MGGFNWIDLIIILLVAGAFYRGYKTGFLALVLALGGLFAALFVGSWLFPRILSHLGPTWRSALGVNLILLFGVLVAIRLLEYGQRLHISLGRGRLHLVESAAGVILSVGSTLIVIWLLAAALGSLPFAGLSNSANDSRIVQILDQHLPAVPVVFGELSGAVDPNATPRIYIKQLADSSNGAAPVPPATPAVLSASKSVVRITSFGCGGIVEGSGFAIAPDLVATNAHVIAGVKRPIVKYRLRSLEGEPVFFDSAQDFAVLRVEGLNAQPLKLSSTILARGTVVYAAGYPKSIYTISPGLISQNLHVLSHNIYGLGTFDRNIYELSTAINSGSSGGPVLTDKGGVAGVIFGKTTSDDNAVALTLNSIEDDIHQAKASTTRVGTGPCIGG